MTIDINDQLAFDWQRVLALDFERENGVRKKAECLLFVSSN
jgi:hypothetical protein